MLWGGGAPVVENCSGSTFVSGKIEQWGSEAGGSGKLKLLGCSLKEPSGCTTSSTLETDLLNFKLIEASGRSYLRFQPASSLVIFNWPLSGCALAPGGNVEGSFGAGIEPAGVFVEEQPFVVSRENTNAVEGVLSFGGAAVELTFEMGVGL
jgi:hypothetical protein